MGHPRKCRTAIVLSGGGTRGAYEAGVVHYVRTMLPPKVAQQLVFHIYCGSSVGAINAAFMAATAHDPVHQGSELVRMWRDLRTENIYRSGPVTLGKLIIRSLIGITSHLFGLKGFAKPNDRSLHFQGFFDTEPFFHFVRQQCPWPNISRNIENGALEALVISATNMVSGQLELFLQKRPDLPHTDRILTRLVRVSPRHVLASAALPLLFPPVPIHGIYYNDGGMRLNTPLAPAVSLGASRILLITTRYHPTRDEADTSAHVQLNISQPTLGEVLGKLYHAILLDRVDADRDQLDRINRILVACSSHLDPQTYQAICTQAGVQQIETLSISPSYDISKLVDETLHGSFRNVKTFSSLEKFILKILEADPRGGTDFLSYFLFEPAYLKKLIDLGFEDARTHHDALVAFGEKAISEMPVD